MNADQWRKTSGGGRRPQQKQETPVKHFAALNATVATMLMGLSSHAGAQVAVAATAEQPTDDIVVTGSRVTKPNLPGSSPVLSVSSQEISMQGTTNVETLLNDLPQISGSNTGALSTLYLGKV